MRNSRQQFGGPQGVALGRLSGTARGTAIVRAGHPALDAALTSDANRRCAARTVSAMREAAPAPSISGAPQIDAPAPMLGRAPEQLSITADRHTGTATIIHAAVTRSVVSRSGRRFELRVWRELAQQSWN